MKPTALSIILYFSTWLFMGFAFFENQKAIIESCFLCLNFAQNNCPHFFAAIAPQIRLPFTKDQSVTLSGFLNDKISVSI
jgi:hypothetical protein